MEDLPVFSVHKRPTKKKGKYVYYYQLKRDGRNVPHHKSQKYTTARSTGQVSEEAARQWVIKEWYAGRILTSTNLTFEQFTEKFFIPEVCPYMKRRAAEGSPVGKSYAGVARGYIKNHLNPELGRKKIVEIERADIQRLKMNLLEKNIAKDPEAEERFLSPTSINHILTALKAILDEAVEEGILRHNPADGVKRLRENAKSRGVLSMQEVTELFKKENYKKIWDEDLKNYMINYLAAWSGMRMGEIQALKIKHVHDDHIDVVHSWERNHGIKGTKTGHTRQLSYLRPGIYEGLRKLIEYCPSKDPDSLVFWGNIDGATPVDHKTILENFKKALRKIKIDENIRKQRNITFHSWRHFLNTTLRAYGWPDWMIRHYTGHRTEAMTENYHHTQLEHFQDAVEQLQSRLPQL